MPQPYALPELIGARLGTQSLNAAILYAADLDGVAENTQVAPALHVLPYQLTVVDAAIPSAIALKEVVLIVAVVRFANQSSGQGVRQLAAPLLANAALALTGWQPTPSYEALQIETPPSPRLKNGYGSYPLQFSTRYQLSAL